MTAEAIIFIAVHKKKSLFFYFLQICKEVGYSAGLLDGRQMEICGINILYVMTTPMGNIMAITLMNSQHTVPYVNITA